MNPLHQYYQNMQAQAATQLQAAQAQFAAIQQQIQSLVTPPSMPQNSMPQSLTAPSTQAEIAPTASVVVYNVGSKEEADNWQVPEGAIVLLCQSDGQAVYVKRTIRNGIGLEAQMETYVKEAIEEPAFQMPSLDGLEGLSDLSGLEEVKTDIKQIKNILEEMTNATGISKVGEPAIGSVSKTNQRGKQTKQPSDSNTE